MKWGLILKEKEFNEHALVASIWYSLECSVVFFGCAIISADLFVIGITPVP